MNSYDAKHKETCTFRHCLMNFWSSTSNTTFVNGSSRVSQLSKCASVSGAEYAVAPVARVGIGAEIPVAVGSVGITRPVTLLCGDDTSGRLDSK